MVRMIIKITGARISKAEQHGALAHRIKFLRVSAEKWRNYFYFIQHFKRQQQKNILLKMECFI